MLEQIESAAFSTDQTGRPGSYTLKVKTFKPKEGEVRDGYVGFETDPEVKLARPKPRRTGMYVSPEGLHTDDPRQAPMDLRAVPQGEPETRDVAVGQPAARRV